MENVGQKEITEEVVGLAHIFLSSGSMLACKTKKKKTFPFI